MSSNCKKLTLKKYLTRTSPPYSANKCRDQIIIGNDGLKYQSKPDKNGIYKWILIVNKKNDKNKTLKKTKKTKLIKTETIEKYYSYFDVYEPFLIENNISHKSINVFKVIYNQETDTKKIGNKIYQQKYKNIFIANDTGYRGNSVLLEINNDKYIFIGGNIIMEFKLINKETIKKFQSPVNPDGFPSPYLVTENNTYLLFPKVIIPNILLDMSFNPYDQYYDYTNQYPNLKRKIQKQSKSLNIKTIYVYNIY